MATKRLTDLARIRQMQASGEARRIRERAHLTASDLAGALDVELSTLRRWEDGRNRPRPVAALAWLDALDALAAEQEDDDQEDALAATGA